jgi:hypothetical protein
MAVELIVLGVRQYKELEARPGREVGPPFGWQRSSLDMVCGWGWGLEWMLGWLVLLGPALDNFAESLMERFEGFFFVRCFGDERLQLMRKVSGAESPTYHFYTHRCSSFSLEDRRTLAKECASFI